MKKKLERLYDQQDGLCFYCGKKAYPDWTPLHNIKETEGVTTNSQAQQFIANTDHLKPKSKGGSNADFNLVMSHIGCNSKKANNLEVQPVAKVVQMLPKHKRSYVLSVFWGLA